MVSIKTLIGGKQEDKTFAIRKFYFEKRNWVDLFPLISKEKLIPFIKRKTETTGYSY